MVLASLGGYQSKVQITTAKSWHSIRVKNAALA